MRTLDGFLMDELGALLDERIELRSWWKYLVAADESEVPQQVIDECYDCLVDVDREIKRVKTEIKLIQGDLY